MRPVLAVALPFLMLHMTAACGPADGDPPPPPEWEITHEGLPGAMLSVWADKDDVFAVGGQGQVLHFDGSTWTAVETGVTETLWWLTATPEGGIWMVGADGVVIRLDRASGDLVRHDIETEAILFGIWGTGDDDLWAVGGQIGAAAAPGEVHHWDGAAWTADDSVPADVLSGRILYKIWGRNADDIWVVGSKGLCLRRTAEGWSEIPTGTTEPLFTVTGDDDLVIAVGGAVGAAIVVHDGNGFSDESGVGTLQLNGVHMRGARALATGFQGDVWERTSPGVWEQDEDAVTLDNRGLHAIFIAPNGDLWGAGGFILANPPTQGVLVHQGTSSLAP